MNATRLMIVDDAHMFVQLLSMLFRSDEQLQVVGTAGNPAEALELATQTAPDLVLLDIKMPGGSGLDMIAPLRETVPCIKILMLSAFLDPFTVQQVVGNDVDGYVEKISPLSVLQEAVHCVRQGGSYFSPGFLALQKTLLNTPEAFHKILSVREQKLLQLLSLGLNDAEIADKNGISVHTVVTSRKRIRGKLNLHSDRALLSYARRWGLDSKGPAHTN
jgi:two-component system NarL family response regulator